MPHLLPCWASRKAALEFSAADIEYGWGNKRQPDQCNSTQWSFGIGDGTGWVVFNDSLCHWEAHFVIVVKEQMPRSKQRMRKTGSICDRLGQNSFHKSWSCTLWRGVEALHEHPGDAVSCQGWQLTRVGHQCQGENFSTYVQNPLPTAHL